MFVESFRYDAVVSVNDVVVLCCVVQSFDQSSLSSFDLSRNVRHAVVDERENFVNFGLQMRRFLLDRRQIPRRENKLRSVDDDVAVVVVDVDDERARLFHHAALESLRVQSVSCENRFFVSMQMLVVVVEEVVEDVIVTAASGVKVRDLPVDVVVNGFDFRVERVQVRQLNEQVLKFQNHFLLGGFDLLRRPMRVAHHNEGAENSSQVVGDLVRDRSEFGQVVEPLIAA